MIVCSPTWVASGAGDRYLYIQTNGHKTPRKSARTELVDECETTNQEDKGNEQKAIRDPNCTRTFRLIPTHNSRKRCVCVRGLQCVNGENSHNQQIVSYV